MILTDRKKRFTIKFFLGLLLFLVAVAVFAVIAHEIVQEKEDLFDTIIAHFFSPFSGSKSIGVAKFFSFFGSHVFLLPAHLMIAIILMFQKRWSDLIVTSFMAVSSFIMVMLLKSYFQRGRPSIKFVEVINNFSFPSGHSFSSFVFAAVLIYLVWKTQWKTRWKILSAIFLLLLSLMIGISRIILQVHYPSDVLAGFCIGIAWVVFILWIQSKVLRRRVSMSPGDGIN